jgi:glycosyltransferase involved in cell wall biosynthesis
MRLAVVTDTYADVNGVSRFIQNVADAARAKGRELTVVTSTNIPIDTPRPNVINIPPRFARRMPRYEFLELVWPNRGAIFEQLDRLSPDVVHVSTPGPVGLAGRAWALRRKRPLVGIYHTDFPAYVRHLFHSRPLGQVCAAAMRRFYAPFASVLTRSGAYIEPVAALGIPRDRIHALQPGIDTDRFHPRHREAAVLDRCGVPPGEALNVLVLSRISVEKNLPLIVDAWRALRSRLAERCLAARLLVVGDGPYRESMATALAPPTAATPPDVFFLGFRHGADLQQLHATADLFLFPSATDTLGQVVMESQASGVPALVSDVGGPQEVIAPGATGVVLPATDPRAWTAAILDLLADAPRRRAMAAAARERLAPMTIDASIEHYWSLHEAALAAWRAQAPAGRSLA